MSDSIYKPENLRKLSGIDLYTLYNDEFLKPAFKMAVYKESTVRNIISTSVECGLQSLKRYMKDWSEKTGDEKKKITEFMLSVVTECIEREEAGNYRRGVIKPLYIAKRRLDKFSGEVKA